MSKWDKGAKRLLVAIFLIVFVATTAWAAGNQYISGSRDGEGFVGEDGKSFLYFRGTTDIIMEGATSDTNETTLRFTDATSDNVITVPDSTGTLALTTGSGSLSLNTVTLVVDGVGNEVAVSAGSILIDTQVISGFSNNATLTKSVIVSGTWIVNTDDSGTDRIVNGIFINP